MPNRYYQGFLDRELDWQRDAVRASLNRVGIPSEDWLVDFPLVLRSTHRHELLLNNSISKSLLRGATSYEDFFESDDTETANSLVVASQPTSNINRDIRKRLP
jgi:hypothetical protein